METCSIREILENPPEDPAFCFDFYNLGRGVGDKTDYNLTTKNITSWRIVGNRLENHSEVSTGIFFSGETYLIKWSFQLLLNNSIHYNSMYFYWKGHTAIKGLSPLPDEVNLENVVERISQWSEPTVFIRLFHGAMIVLSGSVTSFNQCQSHLFIIRGELEDELHFIELPCNKASLRSRTSFVLINPEERSIILWHGVHSPESYRKIVSPHECFGKIASSYAKYEIFEVFEGTEDQRSFLNTLEGNMADYYSLVNHRLYNSTPRLFYLNTITGSFLATEVEYPLRSKDYVSSFPFIQSHLYSASQPAVFLLDNQLQVWMWEGYSPSNSTVKNFEEILNLAKETTLNYATTLEKASGTKIDINHVKAGSEPLQFKNLFPFWDQIEINFT